MIRLLLTALVLGLALTGAARADEFRPAYLELTQTDAESYAVLWKRPALDQDTPLALHLDLPVGAVAATAVRQNYALGALVQRWSIRMPGGIEGHEVVVRNDSGKGIDILARYVRLDGTAQVERLSRLHQGFTPTASPGRFEVAKTYLWLGIEHILTGFDHLLFVAAMVLLVRDRRRLLWTITAFTLAHSLTLAFATLGLVHVPGPPVEALIALSIVMVAAEARQSDLGHAGLAARAPWIVAFAFGLLHGLGFAGALAEIGLPPASIPLALLFFNLGVEVGQLLFVSVLLLGAWAFARATRSLSIQGMARTMSITAIGVVSSYWLAERVSSAVL